jgi:hypothetical protein
MAVTASLINGSLSIVGDDAADEIAIVGTANPGELTITGSNGTVVNGLANVAATIGGVIGGLAINSDGGDDVISLDNVFLAASIFITTGEGDDRVTLGARGEVSANGELDIDTGPGNDQVYELNHAVFVVGSNLINLGNGFDGASIIGASATGGAYGTAFPLRNTKPSISVTALDGQDNILAVGLTARITISLTGSGGSSIALLYSSADGIDVFNGGGTTFLDTNYSVTSVNINAIGLAGGPRTSVTVNRCLIGGLFTTLGPSNNFVSAYGNYMTGAFPSRAGEPGTVLSGLYVFAARAASSEPPYQNQNEVEASYNVFDRGAIHLGDGNDSLVLIGNSATQAIDVIGGFNRTVDLDGFGGFNRIVDQGNTLSAVARKNFMS